MAVREKIEACCPAEQAWFDHLARLEQHAPIPISHYAVFALMALPIIALGIVANCLGGLLAP